MKLKHSIYIVPMVLLVACNSEKLPTADHPDGPIALRAGIVEGRSAVTKAGAEDNHASHLNLTADTQLALQVSGTWTGHGTGTVTQTTTATVGSATGADNKHNSLSCSPVLYWDDYGTADPDNTVGRTAGLTIFGAAINGKTSLPTELTNIANWEALSWTLLASQTTLADKDLLISNNVKAGTGDGTYTFAARAAGKLLEFRHALSKVTVNLRAGEGFGGSFGSTAVLLTSNTTPEWTYTTGTVNITTGAVSAQGTLAAITMAQKATANDSWTVTKEALVIPGSAFAADNATIAKISADGNIYYVTAEKIRTAINSSTHATDGAYQLEAGKNYILNIIVNKTRIDVTATVADWTDVVAVTEAPVINVNADWGQTGTSLDQGFSFFISETPTSGYGTDDDDDNDFDPNSAYTYSAGSYTPDPQLYWPTHATAYYFRGVYPSVTTTDEAGKPVVTAVDGTQVIAVTNGAYNASTFPSNLMIGMPRDTNGNDVGAKTATEGEIRLNFEYMMSHITVILKSTGAEGVDKVNIDENTTLKILNGYTAGNIPIGSTTAVGTGSRAAYTMNRNDSVTDKFQYDDIVLPQALGSGDSGLKFEITVDNGDSTTDTYTTVYGIGAIKVTIGGESNQTITSWNSGHHYVYELDIKKTGINITATLATWTTVDASEEVWF